jgi:hypothetical protein
MPYLRSQAVAASESAASVSFVVTLDEASSNEVRVSYSFDNGTAVYSGSAPDFVTQSGVLVFAPGETSKTVSSALVNNTAIEATEVFWLDLSSPVSATVAQRYTPAFIFDNDAGAGTPVLAVSDPVVDESAGSASFFVWLSQPSALPVSVNWATADGTAVAGLDYTAGAGVLSFAAGETVKTVTVPIVDDLLAETREVFRVQLSEPSGATLARPFGQAEIGASDGSTVGAPYVTARPVAAFEGDTQLNFVISLSAPSTNEVRVNFGLDNGTAVYSGSAPDFSTYSGTLVFAPGETTKALPVTLVDNSTAEAGEVFWLDLSSPVNATVQQRYTPAYLVDDDASTGTPVLLTSEPVVDESAGTASFFVRLSRPSASVVTVDYQTGDDTTAAADDYRAQSGSLNFQPGEMVKTVTVDLVDDDLSESTEFFNLILSNANGATLGNSQARAEIGPSDGSLVGAPYISARPAAAGEGDGTMAFVIGLSAPSTNEVRVNFSLDNGSAVYSGSAPDFSTYSGTLVFAPGETTKTLPLNLIDNTTQEADEIFWLDLASPVNGVVTQRYTPAMIVDNDAATGTPVVSVGDAVVDESARVATFAVSLSRPSSTTVTVDFGTANDTAVAGADFGAASGSLRFEPGETAKTVRVELLDDALAESDEFFQLLLSNPAGASLGDAVGAARMGRSDGSTVSQPKVTAQPVVASEGDGRIAFVVQLSAASNNEVRVNFSFDNGTAVYSGGTPDFVTYSGTLVFAPGETSKSLSTLLIDNTTAEGDETFTLSLTSPVNATVPQRFITATVLDDDGASTVFSRGIGNDRYTITSALDRIAESVGGGIDTAVSSINYTLPDNVENLVLTGAAVNALGNAGNNVLRGTAANNVLDGKDGVDTAVFSGPVADYAIGLAGAQRTVSGGGDGTDTLTSIERLQFSDQILASDTTASGNTYLAYAMLNAAFNAAPDIATLSQWTAQLDRLGNLSDLAQAMINHYAPGVSDEVLVEHLWATIVETPIPLDALSTYVGLVRDGTYSQAGLVELVTTLDLNTVEIVGIVGQTLVLDPAFFPVPVA